MTPGRLALFLALFVAALTCAAAPHHALAQGRNPFSVGISEGGGSASGLTGWILSKQQHFDMLMRDAVRATRSSGSALWGLLGVAFAYGALHAAGPGHGKAVLSAYLIANERALKRGAAMAVLAALLQATVAVALVGGLAVLAGATARAMRDAAQWIELGSYAAIAGVGAALVWRKGAALWREYRTLTENPVGSRFVCVPVPKGRHVHGPECGHFHMPDPAALSSSSFSVRDAAGTVLAAGLRPCSGAILILVFAAAQGSFFTGVGATFAMAAGTAATTAALACVSVYAKALARRATGTGGARGMLILRGLELVSALAVMLFGLGLVTGTLTGIA